MCVSEIERNTKKETERQDSAYKRFCDAILYISSKAGEHNILSHRKQAKSKEGAWVGRCVL